MTEEEKKKGRRRFLEISLGFLGTVFAGGVIPRDDIPKLEAEGIERIYTPGATTGEIVEWLRERLGSKATPA